MMSTAEKATLKETLRELIKEEHSVLKDIVREILAEMITEKEVDFDVLLKNNFDRFDETFKALA
ncbi:hypothetical protein [Lacihabitans lacunae]|jgi:hypothetical protein|uniref:Uncharacterized protein n=1 Tax=Lacihabitans lacunae TaxID=1028214 RepID=A0ABV7YXI3_9BACT